VLAVNQQLSHLRTELKRMNRTKITALSIMLVILLVLVFRHTVGISQARDAAEIASQITKGWNAQGEMADPDFRKLSLRVGQASATLDRARSNMVPGLQIASSARWLPFYGDRLGMSVDLVHIADDLFDGGIVLADVVSGLDDIRFLTSDALDGLPTVEPVLFEQLQEQRESLVYARERFVSARKRLDALSDSDSGLEYLVNNGDIGPAIDLMDSLVGLALLFADRGHELFGFEGDARYIIVAINADEIRAGGGFSPGFWDIQIFNGKIIETAFYDSFEVGAAGAAPATPPLDMLRSMWAGGWFLPDAAWYPDTDRTTSFITSVIEQSVGIDDISAVIFVDQWAALSFISIAGEVSLDDGRFVDENSFFELMQERTDVEGRKYLSTVFDGLLNSYSVSDAVSSAGPMMLKLFEALESRHMQIQLLDENAQEQFEHAGFGSVLAVPEGSDYLFVTDSNVGFSKVNRNISRELRYEVDLTELSSPSARLTVTHRNRSVRQENEDCEIQDARVAGSEYADSMNACYWNLSQLYIPSDRSNLIAPSFPMPEGALYRTVGYDDVEDTFRIEEKEQLSMLSGLFTVAPGEVASQTYEYGIPAKLLTDSGDGFEYKLHVPKQAGLRNSTAVIEITMPTGYGLKYAEPAPLIISNGRALFDEPQDRDLTFRMIFSESGSNRNGRNFRPVPKVPDSSVVDFASVSIFGSVEFSTMRSARINPSVIRLAPGDSIALSAVGIDQNSRRMDGTSSRWIITDPQAGSIDRQGVFTASAQTGVFRNAVEVSVILTDSFGTRTSMDFATVEIFDPELDILDRVVAYPPEVRVLSSQIVALRAIPWTVGNRIAKDTRVVWRVDDESIGTIDSFGFLKVTGAPGIYPNAITAVATQPERGSSPAVTKETRYTFIVPAIESFDNLARVTVIPRTANLRGGQPFRFVPRAFTDRATVAENVEWRWENPDPKLGTIDSNGVFTAADNVGASGAEGIVTVIATQIIDGETIEIETVATINLLPPVSFQPLEFAEITSGTVRTGTSNRVLLTASGYSAAGVRLARLTPSWIVIDPRAGRIQSGKTFVAGRTAGFYEGAIQLRLLQRDENGELIVVTESADVVIASDVVTVNINPIPEPLARGQSTRLEAVAFDSEGRIVPGVAFVWHVMDPKAGIVRPGGVFTAGLIESDYQDVIRVYVARGR
jgi:hypothetical protein